MRRRYLLDTGIMSDFINHRRGVDGRVREAQDQGARIGTCLPVVGELFQGIELSSTRDANLKRLKRALSRIVMWPLNRESAEEFGRLAAILQRAGRSIGQIDTQIAAIALSIGCTVVSKDKDLTTVPGLKVENWAIGQRS